MREIVFDEELHKYFINGIEYPSVTEICEPISFKKLDAIQKSVIERSAARGSAIHELISDYVLTEEYDIDEIQSEYIPYFGAFLEWWRTYRPKTLYSELKLGNPIIGFCGTCDFICIIDGELVLIDFKTTSALDKKYLSVQLAGYKKLCFLSGLDIQKTYALHLKKDGKYSFVEIIPDNDWFELLISHNKKMRSKYGEQHYCL